MVTILQQHMCTKPLSRHDRGVQIPKDIMVHLVHRISVSMGPPGCSNLEISFIIAAMAAVGRMAAA